jgi:hypothetical protein
MRKINVHVTFFNRWKSQLDIISLLDEIDFQNAEEALDRAPFDAELSFGPIGPPRNVWQGREDVLSRLEWLRPSDTNRDRRITLVWPIRSFQQPTFIIPPIFTGVEFLFNTPVRRGDASQFLKFRRYITEVVEIPQVQRIRVNMTRIDAFYLAFPFFMQFKGNRMLTLHVERLLLPQKTGWETCWLRRQWKVQRTFEGKEEDVTLEELAKYAIHVHPARLFEKLMLKLLFSGERNVQEIICLFHDQYSRRS